MVFVQLFSMQLAGNPHASNLHCPINLMGYNDSQNLINRTRRLSKQAPHITGNASQKDFAFSSLSLPAIEPFPDSSALNLTSSAPLDQLGWSAPLEKATREDEKKRNYGGGLARTQAGNIRRGGPSGPPPRAVKGWRVRGTRPSRRKQAPGCMSHAICRPRTRMWRRVTGR